MDSSSPRWVPVTPSQYAWEEEALEKLRALLPDAEPFRAWLNFEFTDGGRIHEADSLVITPKGVFLIEIKSWSGRVSGDQGTWVQQRRDGSRQSYGNPAQLNMAKVRSLASLIRRNWSGGPTAPRTPFIESLVWFSNPNLRVGLPPELRGQVAVADDNESADHIQTITDAIIDFGTSPGGDGRIERVTPAQSAEFAAAMGRIGFKESTRSRTAGSYVLELPAFAERGSTQDFNATHKLQKLRARVRIFSNVVGASEDEAKALRNAADREFMATRNLPFDGIVQAIDMDETEFGPAVVFEHHEDAVRLDHFLAERGDDLDTDQRLQIMEQITATVRQMHGRRISHRMLTPESVWLRPASRSTGDVGTADSWEPLISDFSLAAREEGQTASTVVTYTRVGSLTPARTGAAEVVLGDPSIATFLAPETFTESDPEGIALDAFSIGALTYLLFTGDAPAKDRNEMRQALGRTGLSLSAVIPEIDPNIETLVRRCTAPIVSDRLTSTSEILDLLALARGIEAEGGDGNGVADPLAAEPGDRLADRFEVKRRLGKGSTAVALWCHDERHDRDVVLKIASKPDDDERLRREGDALSTLRQQNLVELFEAIELGGRQVLVLSFAGEQSLAGYLREEGPVSTDFLRRWGEDLLEAVRYLERVGVTHRDVKPDNLGVIEMGPRKQSHLVLFDFSLAGTPVDDITAGTLGYLDPFLGDDGRGRFDTAAERYAAAVTIHEMATGETPVWGDGRSDPAYLPDDEQPRLLIEAIDPEVRSELSAFLIRALQRDPAQRFDSADDMARAWLAVFADWEERPDGDGLSDAEDATETADVLPDRLSLRDPIASLQTSKKVRSALRKLNAETVHSVAFLNPVSVNSTRGVSVKTRKQVLRIRAALLERFGDELADAATRDGPDVPVEKPAAVDSESEADQQRTAHEGKDATAGTPVVVAAPLPDIDRLGTFLLPPPPKRGRTGSVRETVSALLGLDRAREANPLEPDWPTVTGVAEQIGISTPSASRTLQKARDHWTATPALMAVGADLLEILSDLDGVAGVSELSAALLSERGSGHEDSEALRLANAVVRAVLESGGPITSFVTVRRTGLRTLVAVEGSNVTAALAGDSGSTGHALIDSLDPPVQRALAAVDSSAAIDLAVRLGARADILVATAPLVSSGDALADFRSLGSPFTRSLSDSRVLRLAGAASDDAMTNPAGDLVRRNASPVEALRWSRAAIISAPRLTAEEIEARVVARFPHVSLPGPPQLDQLLDQAGLRLTWSAPHGLYRSDESGPGGVGPITQIHSRQQTVVDTSGITRAPAADAVDSDTEQAIEADERLERSRRNGGFLTLRVPTDRLVQAKQGLSRFTNSEPPMESIDLEAVFLRSLRQAAEARRVKWSNLEAADDRSDLNWDKLEVVAADAVDATLAEVAKHRYVIAWHPGLLARYRSKSDVAPLDQLRDLVGDRDHELRTLWLVVLGSTADALPRIDGTPVPNLAASQWMDLPYSWLENTHRSGGRTA